MTEAVTYGVGPETFHVNYDGSDDVWQASQNSLSGDLDQWQFPYTTNDSWAMVFAVSNIGDDTIFVWACNSNSATPPPPDDTDDTLYGFKLSASTPSASPDGNGQITITNILVVQANTLISDDPKVKLTASHGQGIVSGEALTFTWDGTSGQWTYYPDEDTAAAQIYQSGSEIQFNNTADPFTVNVSVCNHSETCSAALYSSSSPPSASGIILACDTNVTEEQSANFDDVSASSITNSDSTFTVNLFTPRDDDPTTTLPEHS